MKNTMTFPKTTYLDTALQILWRISTILFVALMATLGTLATLLVVEVASRS